LVNKGLHVDFGFLTFGKNLRYLKAWHYHARLILLAKRVPVDVAALKA
jgi:hypothetical protein